VVAFFQQQQQQWWVGCVSLLVVLFLVIVLRFLQTKMKKISGKKDLTTVLFTRVPSHPPSTIHSH
jgi:hypothetical protein